MLKVYTTPSCASCKKVKEFFNEHHIPFQEINFFKRALTYEEIKEILEKSLDGTDEIISTRSNVFKEKGISLDKMSFNELVNFIMKYPSILKRPIIVSDHAIQVGYDEEEIRIFLPRIKGIILKKCRKEYLNKTYAHFKK